MSKVENMNYSCVISWNTVCVWERGGGGEMTNSVIWRSFVQSDSVTSLCSPFTAFILFFDISQLCPFHFLHFSNFSLPSFRLPLFSLYHETISVTCPFCFIRYIVIKRELGHWESKRKCVNVLFLVWIKGNYISGIIYLPLLATVHCFKSEFHIMATL